MNRFVLIFAFFLLIAVQNLHGQTMVTPGTSLLPNGVAVSVLPDGTTKWTHRDFVVEKFLDNTVRINAQKTEWVYYANGRATILSPQGKWTREPSGIWTVSDAMGTRQVDVSSVPPPPQGLPHATATIVQPANYQGNGLSPTLLPQPYGVINSNITNGLGTPVSSTQIAAVAAPVQTPLSQIAASPLPPLDSQIINSQVQALPNAAQAAVALDTNAPLANNLPPQSTSQGSSSVLNAQKVGMDSYNVISSAPAKVSASFVLVGLLAFYLL